MIQQKGKTVLGLYEQNDGASKYKRPKLKRYKEKPKQL